MPPGRADAVTEQFRLRSVAVAAFGPATLFGLAEGAMLPVIALSSIDRGASTAIAALINALLGVGSLVTNIPSGILATRIGERRSMLVAAAVAGTGLILCLVNLGRGGLSLVVFGSGVLLLGAASSVYTLARQSYLTEIVPREMRARALSTLGGTLRIGMFAGPFLGAGAEELWGLPGAYYVSLAAMTGAAVIVYRVPDLDKSDEHKAAAAEVTSRGILKRYWRTFATLGTGVVLLQAIRQTRQVVIPLWAAHIGLSPTASSVIYGIAGLIDLMTFYPAGKVMDLHGRRWVAVPCAAVLGISFVVMPFTHAASTLSSHRSDHGLRQRHRLGYRHDARGRHLSRDRPPEVPRPMAGTVRRRSGHRPAHPVRSDRRRRAGRRHHRHRRGRLRRGRGHVEFHSPTTSGWQADSMKDSTAANTAPRSTATRKRLPASTVRNR